MGVAAAAGAVDAGGACTTGGDERPHAAVVKTSHAIRMGFFIPQEHADKRLLLDVAETWPEGPALFAARMSLRGSG